jgi:hypothetical protein
MEAVTELAVVAKNFPQSAYSGLQKSLQQEWQFVQRVKEGVSEEFTNTEEAISQTFSLLCLAMSTTMMTLARNLPAFRSSMPDWQYPIPQHLPSQTMNQAF